MRDTQTIQWVAELLYGNSLGNGYRIVTAERQGAEDKNVNKNIKSHTSIESIVETAVLASDAGFDVNQTPFLFDINSNKRTTKNARYTRALYIDIDVRLDEPEKGTFRSNQECINALWSLNANYGFPTPSIVVTTGGERGIHAYWLFSEYITVEQYVMLGTRLRALLVHASKQFPNLKPLTQDMARLSDPASLMRIPGTFNSRANDIARVVYGQDNTTFYDFNQFDALFAQILEQYHVEIVNKAGNIIGDQPERVDPPNKTTHYGMMAGCASLRWAQVNQDAVSEPAWRNILGLTNFLKEGLTWARYMSDQHVEFDEEEMKKKVEGWHGNGPPTCAAICDSLIMSQGFDKATTCDVCEYKRWLDNNADKGLSIHTSSPLNIAQMNRKLDLPTVQVEEIEEETGTYGTGLEVVRSETKQTTLAEAITLLVQEGDELRALTKMRMELVNGQICGNDTPLTAGLVWVSDVFSYKSDVGDRTVCVLSAVHASEIDGIGATKAKVIRKMVDLSVLQDSKQLVQLLANMQIGAAQGTGAGALSALMLKYVTFFFSRNGLRSETQPNIPYFDRKSGKFYLYGHIIGYDGNAVSIQHSSLYEYLLDTHSTKYNMIEARLPNPMSNPDLTKRVWDAYATVKPLIRILMYAPTAALWMSVNPESSARGLWVHFQGQKGSGKTTLAQVATALTANGNFKETGASGSHAGRVDMIRFAGSTCIYIDEITAMNPSSITELGYGVSDGRLGNKANSDGSMRTTGYYAPPPGDGSISLLTTGNISIDGSMDDSELTPTQKAAIASRIFDIELSQQDRPELNIEFIENDMAEYLDSGYGAMLLPVLRELLKDSQAVTKHIAKWRNLIREGVEDQIPYGYSSYRIVGAQMAACLAVCELMASEGMTADNPYDLLPAAVEYITDQFNVAQIATTLQTRTGVSTVEHGNLMRRIRSYLADIDNKGGMFHNEQGLINPRIESGKAIAPIGRWLFAPDSYSTPIGAVVSVDAMLKYFCGWRGEMSKSALIRSLSEMAKAGLFVVEKQGSLTSMISLANGLQQQDVFTFTFLEAAQTHSGDVVSINTNVNANGQKYGISAIRNNDVKS